MPFGIPASIIGLVVVGDLAGQTIYTDRHGRKIYYPQSPPNKPASPMQIKQRARFQTAVENWKATDPTTRIRYEDASLAASLAMTGLNLWVSISLTEDVEVLETIARQTGIPLSPPPGVPWPNG